MLVNRFKRNWSLGPMLHGSQIINLNLHNKEVSEFGLKNENIKAEVAVEKNSNSIETKEVESQTLKFNKTTTLYDSITTSAGESEGNIMIDRKSYLGDKTYQNAKRLLGRKKAQDINKLNEDMVKGVLPSNATEEQKRAFSRGREYSKNKR